MSVVKNLRAKILLASLIPGTLALVAVALIALFAYEGVARNVVQQRDTELAKISAARLSEGLTRHSGTLQTAADDDDLQSLEPARIGRALERVQIELFAFDAGVVIYNDQAVAVGSDPFAFKRRGEDYPVRSEFDKVRTTRRPSFSNVFEDAISGEEVILVTVPIVASGNEFKGVLAGMSTLKSLVSDVTYSKVLEITAGRKGFAYLVDGQGQTIYHRDTSLLGESLVVIDPVTRATRGETGAVIADDPTGESVISGFAPVPDTDFSIEWAVITQDRWKDVVGPIRRASRLMLGLLVLGGVLASALVFFAIGRVLKPVKDLTEGAKRIAGGDFDHTIAARTGDEIQALADQFNTMAVALKESYAGLERKVAERTEELRESNQTLRTLIQASPLPILALDRDAKVRMWTPAAEATFGWTEQEVIGRALPLVPADEQEQYRADLGRALQGEALVGLEVRRQKKDGSPIDVSIWTAPLRDAQGDISGVMGVIADLTERKQAEEALRRGEEETRQLARENSVMAEIGRVIGSSLDVDAVYEHFAEHVQELIPFDRIDITLPGAEPGTVMHAYQAGVKAPGRMRGDVYPLAGTATEEVLKTGEEMLFHPGDVDEVDGRFPGLRPAFDSGLRSFMGIPLVTRSEVLGTLFIASKEPDAYSTRDLSMAKRVGSQIAGAIANAQLYADRARAEQAQARLAQRLNLLNEIMRIAVSNLNVTEVFDGVSEQVKKLIDHDRLSIDLLRADESSSELYPFVAVGLGAVDRGLSMPLASPVGEVVRTGKPILRGDLLQGGAYPIEAKFARTTGIRSAMFVPLASRGRVIGCLTFSSLQADNYDERELDTAQTIADHLAVIVEHAQLYEETKRAEEQLRAINDVAISTSSVLQLDDLLPYVTGLLHDTFAWDVVNVLLTDDKSENVVLRATLGHRDKAVAPGFTVDMEKQGIISWVAKTGEPLLANDVSQEPRYHLNEARPHIKAELAVAIKQGDDVLGVLDIESERLDAFDRTDVSTAQSLANQLAVAIENARLFELARDLAVLEERNRMAREIHDTMAQGFTGIVLQLEAAEQAFESTPTEIPDHLGRAKDLARTCLQEARRSVWNLLPRALEERHLSEALQNEVAQWASDGPETARFTLSGPSRELDADIQAALLRICQESLTNIRKHAGASQVSVQVTYLPSSVRLEIRDDGVGFDANAKSQDGMQGGFGLLGMEQRARLIRGKLEVKTEQGHGTTISIEVPTG